MFGKLNFWDGVVIGEDNFVYQHIVIMIVINKKQLKNKIEIDILSFILYDFCQLFMTRKLQIFLKFVKKDHYSSAMNSLVFDFLYFTSARNYYINLQSNNFASIRMEEGRG